ncbi:MAG: hypothetical protein U0670_12490 [Anaerolineae bacterium]
MVAISLVSSSCSVLGTANDPAGTTVADATNAVSEGTAIRQSLDAMSTSVVATAIAAETYVVQRESINAQLLATLRAALPPTQQLVGNAGEGTPSINARPELPGIASQMTPGAPSTPNAAQSASSNVADSSSNGTQFTAVQAANGVNEDDGCALGVQTQFSTSDPEIYVTARAFNIRAGMVMSAQWKLNGSVVYDDYSFTVGADDDDFCLWFSIDPATVPFTPGDWTVQLIADGNPIEPAVSFAIVGS